MNLFLRKSTSQGLVSGQAASRHSSGDASPGGGGSLHVIEPELLLHVAMGHLAERLLVVLHELEDGRQLLFLNSAGRKDTGGESSEPRGPGSPPGAGSAARASRTAENSTPTSPLRTQGGVV
ncbi:hypothetical protein D623_10019806 [Myotis brandtii]|uniref:Uncharacterized protein n=1 Tax=Myotis brandtii TaxID=109478 RepID=S7QCS7_MYOBR|nr:hypothetical protein D623_10019806 [Myotis brandtii]